jgi:hypothetical protein
MTTKKPYTKAQSTTLLRMAGEAGNAIPPAWPLAATVAVNPFMGQAQEPLAAASARLARATGETATMDRSWYRDKVASGAVTDHDIKAAIAAAPGSAKDLTLEAVMASLAETPVEENAVPTVADLAAQVSGIDWPAIIAERVTAWAGSFFDEGQAFWSVPRNKSVFASWRSYAIHDLTSEILGLKGFATHMLESPDQARDMILKSSHALSIKQAEASSYYHQLLMTMGGWAQYGRYHLWQANLTGGDDDIMLDLLAVRIAWEDALLAQYGDTIAASWEKARGHHGAKLAPTQSQEIDAILQEACERAEQRRLSALIGQKAESDTAKNDRPALQLALCIDVRSEVYRRAIESLDPSIETLGFAGFFGLTLSHRRFASDVEELRLPVLLNPSLSSVSGTVSDDEADKAARYKERATRAWGRFKLAAVSTFAFVESASPVYLPKLIRDAFALKSDKVVTDPAPQLVDELPAKDAIDAAETILRAMSLTDNFARLVVMAGHGATVENNPHESALQCGACGGYSGEANARLLAQLLNIKDVRTALVDRGITIPEDTLFLGALHNTTTDSVQIFTDGHETSEDADAIKQAQSWFDQAGKLTRTERSLRLPGAHSDDDVRMRSHDWAQVRPEWGLAGCSAFIAAPRARTEGKDFSGRSFLHNYDWKQDKEFSVLELIMTAPVVVGSWISLQYFGSVTAPDVFGAGNKLLHNVMGGIGVLEGNTGPMRAGLPWQSVHDGEKLMHDPLRLTVCIEAPCEAMTDILERHDGVRALFDNRWLHLIALDEDGKMASRYVGDLRWQPFSVDDAADTPEGELIEAP